MADIKILDQKSQIKGGKVVLTETKEQTLSADEVRVQVYNIQRQKTQLVKQNQALKTQYDALDIKEKELAKLLKTLQITIESL